MFSQAFALTALLAGRAALAGTPQGFVPSTNRTFEVSYGETAVSNGNSVPLDDEHLSPRISFEAQADNTSHVLVMLDLDAPYGPTDNKYSPLLHWSKVFGPQATGLPANGSTAESDFAFYVSPNPPVGSAPHRYVLLLFSAGAGAFEIPESFRGLDPANITERLVFDIDGFVREGKLDLAAANWFTSVNSTAAEDADVPVSSAPARGSLGVLTFGAVGLFLGGVFLG